MRNQIIQIKISKEEKDKIIAEAEKVSLPFSAYCRSLVIEKINEEEAKA